MLDGQGGILFRQEMRRRSTQKREQVQRLLAERASKRSGFRIEFISINTVAKLLVNVGYAVSAWHDFVVREVESLCVECDEIRSFCYSNQKNIKTAQPVPLLSRRRWRPASGLGQ